METIKVNQKKAKDIRDVIMKAIIDNGENVLGTEVRQVAGSKCALDYYDKELEDYVRVDLSIIIPKDQDFTSEDLAEEYQNKLTEKAKIAEEKKIAKEKKIARDKKLREQKKKEQE